MSGNKYVSFKNVPGKDIIFKNFAGRPTKYVPDGGRREFTVVFDDDILAQRMIDDGWKIKFRSKGDDDIPGRPSLTVKVNFESPYPPIIEQKSSHGCTRLDAESVAALDFDEIMDAKMRIRGWEYEPGKLSAYLVRMEVDIQDDYADSYGNYYSDETDDLPF